MATLEQRLLLLAARIRTKINEMIPKLLPAGGASGQVLAKSSNSDYAAGWVTPGADPWTRVVLGGDFSNSTVNFNTVTGFTFTPAANTNFLIEAELLVTTAATTSLPRVGVSIGTGQAYGAVGIEYQSGAAARVFTEGQFNTGAVNVQAPAGTAPLATNPFLYKVVIKGRSGASPGAIAIQFAAETAATASLVKQGSEMRSRTM